MRALTRFAILFVILAAAAPARSAPLQTLEIASKTGVHSFAVEMAATEAEREKGLMFRKELPEGPGHAVRLSPDQEVGFWMKNTYIPLDMIFIQGDGRILRIAENTTPLSTKVIPSNGPVRAVLEVIGGTAEKLGIAPGDRVAFAHFRPALTSSAGGSSRPACWRSSKRVTPAPSAGHSAVW